MHKFWLQFRWLPPPVFAAEIAQGDTTVDTTPSDDSVTDVPLETPVDPPAPGTIPPPQTEPTNEFALVPANLRLDSSEPVFGLNQTISITLRVDYTGAHEFNELEGASLVTQLPVGLTLLNTNQGSVENGSVRWTLPTLVVGEPFIRELTFKATTGTAGDSFRIEARVEKSGMQAQVTSALLGLGNLNNHELYVLLDPELVQQGVSASSYPISESVTGTITSIAANDLLPDCDDLEVTCWGAEAKFDPAELVPDQESEEVIEEPAIPTPIVNITATQVVYLPLVRGRESALNGIDSGDEMNREETSGTASPKQTNNSGQGLAQRFYNGWRIDARKLGQRLEKLDRPATLIFSAKKLIKRGIDPTSIQLLTRHEESADAEWEKVRMTYDAKHQVFIVQTNHFSPWILSGGLSVTGNYLPTMTNFSVDRFSGGSSYSFGLETPKGLGGMSPNLSLGYSSHSVDDLHNDSNVYLRDVQSSWAGGLGWNLGGVSYISKNHAKGGWFLVLNGMSGKIVCRKVGGTCVTNEYTTDPEMFLKIEHNAGNQWGFYTQDIAPWIVTTPDGTKYYFGADLNSSKRPNSAATGEIYDFLTNNTSYRLTFYVGDKWYLRRVEDVFGNYMEYSYTKENGTANCTYVNGGGNPDATANGFYTKAIYLSEVRWSANVNGTTPRMKVELTPEARADNSISTNGNCAQGMVGNNRLKEMKVWVLMSNGTSWHLLRKVVLGYGYSTTVNQTYHSLLTSIEVYGKDGANRLSTQTFTYGRGSGNRQIMTVGTNGYGGRMEYEYDSLGLTDCHLEDAYVTCGAPHGGSYDYSRVRTIRLYDGQIQAGLTYGSERRSIYCYGPMRANVRQGGNYEFLGFESVSVTQLAINSANAQTPDTFCSTPDRSTQEARNVEWYYQRTTSSTTAPERGKTRYQALYSGANDLLIGYKSTLWEAPASPRSQDSNWVRVTWDSSATYNIKADGNGDGGWFATTQRPTYDSWGNTTQVEEFDGYETTAATNLKRTSVTEFTLNGTAWILNTPSRVRVFAGTATLANCKAESRTIYWDPLNRNNNLYNRDGNFQSLPWSTLPAKTEQALNGCSDSTIDIPRYSSAWSAMRFGRDVYGNLTASDQVGADLASSLIMETKFDPFYFLFPIEQWRFGFENSGYKEFAWYYGIGTGHPSLYDAHGAYWGAMSEYCAMNEVCTRQSYDAFGRTTNRWENVVKFSAWDTAEHWDTDGRANYYNGAHVQWHYRDPHYNSGFEFSAVTEWRNPRCYGNLKRSIYNGLGQLISERSAQQNWASTYEGCSVTQNQAEVEVLYGYNSLGQVVKTSVPYATNTDWVALVNGINWSSVWNGVAHSRSVLDGAGRVLKSFAPNGEVSEGYYVGRDTLLIGKGRNGDPDKILKWQFADPLGNLLVTRIGTWNAATNVATEQSRVTLTHDVLGNLTNVSNSGSGASTTITYDLGGRKTQMVDADLGTWSYAYDRQGQLIRQTDARGKTTCLYYERILFRLAGKHLRTDTSCPSVASYDLDQRPVLANSATYPILFEYDQNGVSSRGQLTKINNNYQWIKLLYYDNVGRLIQDNVSISGAPSSYNTNYGYDSYNRPTTTTYPDGEVVTTSYNGMGLPNRLRSGTYGDLVDGTQVNAGITNAVNYDEAGRLRNMRFPLGGGLWRTQTYQPWSTSNSFSPNSWTPTSSDSNGRLQWVSLGSQPGWGENLVLEYAYDSHGNIRRAANSVDGSNSTFTYDAQNRLTNGYGQPYTYDPAGRLTNYEGVPMSVASGHPHAIVPTSFAYAYAYDANGNMTGRPGQSLVWDSENHLQSVTGNGSVETYLYDADGQRVKKTTNGVSTFYVNSLYEVTSGSTTLLAASAELDNPATVLESTETAINLTPPGHDPALQIVESSANTSKQQLEDESSYTYRDMQSGAPCTTPSATCIAWKRQAGESVTVDNGMLDPATLPGPEVGGVPVESNPQPPTNESTQTDEGGVSGAAVDALGITNPGFEQGTTGWSAIPTFAPTSLYQSMWGTAQGRTHAGDGDGAHQGYVLSNHAYAAVQSSLLSVTPCAQYDLYAYMRGNIDSEESGGSVIVRAELYNNGTYVGIADATGIGSLSPNWAQVGGRFTVPCAANQMYIQFWYFMNSGWVGIDDVSLIKVGTSTNIAPDPSFEAGTNWTTTPSSLFPATSAYRSIWGDAAPRTGSYAYTINNHAYATLESNEIAVTAGWQYDLYTWVRGELDTDSTTGGWIVRAMLYNSGGGFVTSIDVAGSSTISANWSRQGGRFTVPAGISKMRINLLHYNGSGWVAFDDVY